MRIFRIVLGIVAAIGLPLGAWAQDCSTTPAPIEVKLPANKTVQVSLTSTDCAYFQKTKITWPDQSTTLFVATESAAPDSRDAGYDPANPTTVAYGQVTYVTGPTEEKASIEVWDAEKANGTWCVVQKKRPGKLRSPTFFLVVETEGHQDDSADDWDDTIIRISW